MSRYLPSCLSSDVYNYTVDALEAAEIVLSATQCATADADGLLTSTSLSASETTDEDIENDMPCARNVTATVGGTEANIKAEQVTVTGFDMAGKPLTEKLPAFTADTAGTVAGSCAFAKVTHISCPAMDGAGVTLTIGYGDKYGLPFMLDAVPLCLGSVDGVMETPTITTDDDELAKNVFTFESAPADEAVKLILFI